MSGPTDLYDLAREWLVACSAAVVATPGGAIDRAYVSAGIPALDCCPQLTVHVGGPAEGDTAPLGPPLSPGHRANVQGTVPLVQLTCTVVRCSPYWGDDGSSPPAADALEQVAHLTLADVWAVWWHTRHLYRAGTLFASPGGRRELFFDPAYGMNTSGGCAGWVIPIRVDLGGYPA